MREERIGVIGGSQGMGKWLVNYFQNKGFEVGFSSNDSRTQYLTNVQLVTDSDVIILAVPISHMEKVMDQIFPYLEGRTVIDVCSVKSGIVEKFQRLHELYNSVECSYLSIHPMFAPTIESVVGQVVLFNYAHVQNSDTTKKWKSFFAEDGAQVMEVDHIEHDKTMGIIQGLNHFNVFVSAKTLARHGDNMKLIKRFSSPTYRIFVIFFTRYVMQTPRLYAEIQIFNPYVKEIVRLFMEEAQQLLTVIEQQDFDGFENYVLGMQPFFAANTEDTQLSNYLIEKLGAYMAEKKMVTA
ncbi:MAG: prephenate dehydrogenase/arogenate dehydrogenase family protein [Cyclobacteriaceae bacterium]